MNLVDKKSLSRFFKHHFLFALKQDLYIPDWSGTRGSVPTECWN